MKVLSIIITLFTAGVFAQNGYEFPTDRKVNCNNEHALAAVFPMALTVCLSVMAPMA